MAIPYVREIEFEYGIVEQVSPLIRRVIANNPGPFTYVGTGVDIIGHGEVAVIDPGDWGRLPRLAQGARLRRVRLDCRLHGQRLRGLQGQREREGATSASRISMIWGFHVLARSRLPE